MDTFREIKGWDALSQEFDKFINRLKQLSTHGRGNIHRAVPTIPEQYFDYQHGRHHALISMGVHKGEPLIQYCSIAERYIVPADSLVNKVQEFVSTCLKQPVAAEELANFFVEHKLTDNMATAKWTAASVEERSENPPVEKSLEQRLMDAKELIMAGIAKRNTIQPTETVEPESLIRKGPR